MSAAANEAVALTRGTPEYDAALQALCDEHGLDYANVVECQEFLHNMMLKEACAVAEGMCPRCLGGRLTPVDDERYAGWCQACDLYHHVSYDDDGAIRGIGATTGWWVRGEDPDCVVSRD